MVNVEAPEPAQLEVNATSNSYLLYDPRKVT